jgi:hypothetical protein
MAITRFVDVAGSASRLKAGTATKQSPPVHLRQEFTPLSTRPGNRHPFTAISKYQDYFVGLNQILNKP